MVEFYNRVNFQSVRYFETFEETIQNLKMPLVTQGYFNNNVTVEVGIVGKGVILKQSPTSPINNVLIYARGKNFACVSLYYLYQTVLSDLYRDMISNLNLELSKAVISYLSEHNLYRTILYFNPPDGPDDLDPEVVILTPFDYYCKNNTPNWAQEGF